MAKQPVGKGGTARIRLIVLDAEVPDGDVGQLAQALQNALKPPVHVQQRVVSQPQQIAQRAGGLDAAEGEPSEAETECEVPEEQVASPRPRESKPRKMPTPDMIDLDESLVFSLKDYAASKKPTTDSDKSLLAVAWFNDNGAEDGATTSHVYTVYKYLSWPTGKNKDFGAPLRALKKTAHLKSVEHGMYAVTPFGRTHLKNMGVEQPGS